jgi:hypothetical protein
MIFLPPPGIFQNLSVSSWPLELELRDGVSPNPLELYAAIDEAEAAYRVYAATAPLYLTHCAEAPVFPDPFFSFSSRDLAEQVTHPCGTLCRSSGVQSDWHTCRGAKCSVF